MARPSPLSNAGSGGSGGPAALLPPNMPQGFTPKDLEFVVKFTEVRRLTIMSSRLNSCICKGGGCSWQASVLHAQGPWLCGEGVKRGTVSSNPGIVESRLPTGFTQLPASSSLQEYGGDQLRWAGERHAEVKLHHLTACLHFLSTSLQEYDGDQLRQLAHALCPSIYGHELVKAGILLSLLG